MINRALLRVKVIQIAYSYYKGDSMNIQATEQNLKFSIKKSYDLYLHLLQLVSEITKFADRRIDAGRNKLRPTKEELNPNTKFVENTFARQIGANRELLALLDENKLNWNANQELIKALYDEIQQMDFFQEYMHSPKISYADDKMVWRKIFKKVVLPNEEIAEYIENECIFWTDDLDVVISFIIKTIKRFEEENAAVQPLLPQFRDETDAEFPKKLLAETLRNEELYRGWIDEYTANWELDRIVFMDTLLMQTALAEIMSFPTIPINVTLNEYIEISKQLSTDKSGTFINGILDSIIKGLQKEKKIIKVINI